MTARVLKRLSPASLVVIVVVLVVAGYALYQIKDIVLGPRITVLSPPNGTLFSEPLVEIRGTATNVSHITLNDLPIFTDSDGAFKEKLLLSEGYNIIEISAKDRFGRNTEKILELVLQN